MSVAYVALGVNLGDRAATIESALRSLAQLGELRAVSSLYETDPVGYADQPPYLNAVVSIETSLPALDLLRRLLAIEAEHGRVRTFANAPRTLDLDLLLYGDETVETPELTVPHPRMHERAFVLVPLVEIAPNANVPNTGATARELLGRLTDVSGIARYAPAPNLSPAE
jgi:2-amino-4-hydroxy-6-hydroxymethyldihydropteridine diphosphokinase